MADYVNLHVLNSKQVVWLGRSLTESSWEPESSLPKELVQDFEQGIQHDIHEDVFASGGQYLHTISTKRCESPEKPLQKKICLETSTIESSNKG